MSENDGEEVEDYPNCTTIHGIVVALLGKLVYLSTLKRKNFPFLIVEFTFSFPNVGTKMLKGMKFRLSGIIQ